MPGYYSEKLSAEKLKKCYDIAPPRIQQYLKRELDYVSLYIKSNDKILELGCGYGRAMLQFCRKADQVIGIDTSLGSLKMAKSFLKDTDNHLLIQMDAANLAFSDKIFDMTICIQNGISAFKVARNKLISEAVRVTRQDGTVIFSSYSEKIWNERLNWFELQSQNDLLGEIDYEKTGDGTIVCKDGFEATTINENQFLELTSGLGREIVEIDNSSLFCIIKV
jgi:2-polyprenyl-6-hydroxyphenyl methylase/3-demethylubiquinone-9 3-methyltransferase